MTPFGNIKHRVGKGLVEVQYVYQRKFNLPLVEGLLSVFDTAKELQLPVYSGNIASLFHKCCEIEGSDYKKEIRKMKV